MIHTILTTPRCTAVRALSAYIQLEEATNGHREVHLAPRAIGVVVTPALLSVYWLLKSAEMAKNR